MSTNDIEVGDVVHIGKGKTLWRVQSFWTGWSGETYATLRGVTGYAQTSATLDRLTIVTKAGPA